MTVSPPPPDDWTAVRALFERLLALPSADREAALAASGASAAVQGQVRSLLAHALTESDAFLAQPAAAPALPESDVPPQRAGQRIGPWQIAHLLGRGGMGEVWLARRVDGSFDGQSAIKVLRAGLDSQRVLARFAQEQQALARLNHPHIARLLDAGRTPSGEPYVVMEAVHGRPIDAACAGAPLAQRLALFLQLADAVAHAHRQLLVHRDLKPSNVLVTDDGQVKLLDFGIAKALDPLEGTDPGATVAGERPFTPHYASPEQVRGEPVGTGTDVYSLGVLLYVMLTGVRPYGRQATSAAEAARSVLEEQPTRPSALSPGLVTDPHWMATRKRLQGDLDKVLLKALEKSQDGRYPSVDALAADIRAYLGGFPVSARPAGWAYVARKFARRHRAAVAAAGLGLGALVLGLGLALWQRQQAVDARQQAETQRALAQQRFAQVRQLANQLVFKYHDQIESLPGAAKAREALLVDAAAFLDSLQAAAGDDPGLAEELAATYYRIARLQGVDQSINTGEHDRAEANLAKALALLPRYIDRPQASTAALSHAAEMQVSRGELWQRRGHMREADAALRAGLPWLARALARDPRDTQALAAAISVHGVHARILGSQTAHASLGRWADACASADQARAAAEATLVADPANIYAPDSLAFTLGEQAHCQVLNGRLDQAQALFERQQSLRDQMAAKMPDDMDFRWQRAVVRGQLARVQALQGRHDAARALLAEAQALADRAMAADPGNAGGQRRLDALALLRAEAAWLSGDASATRAAADVLLDRLRPAAAAPFAELRPRTEALLWAARGWRSADPARARRLADEAATLMRPPWADDDNTTRRGLQAQAQGEQAAALAAAGRSAEATAQARAALATWGEAAAASAPPSVTWPAPWQPWLAQARRLAGA